MYQLTIITITYNNLSGLRRTMDSVVRQVSSLCEADIAVEQVVVDGGSTDGTVAYLQTQQDTYPLPLRWVSEPDGGVYDAQNKGIGMATGEYCYFLNAGDVLVSDDVLSRMMQSATADIVYGNEIVVDAAGHAVEHCRGVEHPTFLDLYHSCMKHQASFIRRRLFDQYGGYDASLRIVADWEWFLRVMGYHREVTLDYRDVDVAYFGNDGISYHEPALCARERQQVLDRYLSATQQHLMHLWHLAHRCVRYIRKRI